MKTNQYTISYYNSYDEDSRPSPKYGIVEFLATMRYIEKYIEPGSRVLETGAGTDRYSHALARQGYIVGAMELVPYNIEVLRKYMLPTECITIIQGDALDLSAFPDNQYDITLLLGPLYYLYGKEEKRQALGETIRITKQGDIVFAVYVISDDCLLDEGFNRGDANTVEYIKNGLLSPGTFAAKSEPRDLFELARKEDVDDLMSILPATRLHCAAADGCVLLIRGATNKMDDEAFRLYLRCHYAACERKDLTGITSHTIDVFQK